MSFGHNVQCKLRVEKSKVVFMESARPLQTQRCTWRDDKVNPCYCKKADLKFEANLPDRKYLTRFSARCASCYDQEVVSVHLYCAFCDEVLTGSIAGPGGKISDHLITIRHVYQQAVGFNAMLEQGTPREQDVASAMDYVTKLDEWSGKIRYPMRTTIKRIHLDEIVRSLHENLVRLPPLRHAPTTHDLPLASHPTTIRRAASGPNTRHSRAATRVREHGSAPRGIRR